MYAARASDGGDVVLKVFDGMAISRPALQTSAKRLAAGGWPDGVMRVLDYDYNNRPAYHVMPMAADTIEGRRDPVPRSLQHQLDAHPGEDTWPVLRGIARALAAMHHKRVAHANLKPGNVFFSESGEVMLADWALGNMPGVGHMKFTDALLYQPPAQLRSPDGFFHEDGYRWDVYAFGTLAYRLLTGRFPRCHEIFASVAPPQGLTRRDDIHADLTKLAANLERHATITWPDEPADDVEAGMREWIVRCLDLDPHKRPASMIDVVAGFERVEQDVATHKEHARLLDRRRRAGRRALRAYVAFAIAAAAAVVMAALWWMETTELEDARAANVLANETIAETRQDAAMAVEAAEAARSQAEAETRATREAMGDELKTAKARLHASREIGDRLFAWSIKQDHLDLPPLDDRQQRLEQLADYFTGFLEETSGMEGLEVERARAQLQLAEISLAAGDVEHAGARLAVAADAAGHFDEDAAHAFRMARNMVLLGLLQHGEGKDAGLDTFRKAGEMLAALPPGDAEADRVRHLSAVVDIHLAGDLSADGGDEEALELLVEASQVLDDLADARPESRVLSSQLAETYMTSATILDALGRSGEARETRELAIAGLRRLLDESPDDARLMLTLAGGIGAMAESAVLAGNIDEAMEKSSESAALLDAVLSSQPDNPTAISRKAAQLGLRAGILRDQGKAGEAIERYTEGIGLLEAARESKPEDGMIIYRLALLTWQMARMTGIEGDLEAEIVMLRKAVDLIGQSESAAASGGPREEQTQLSSAYLFGDLGHALELDGEKEEAIAAFEGALESWRALVDAHPEREEFADGLAWCERRLAELAE